MNFLRRYLPFSSNHLRYDVSAISPERPFIAVGDIHGRFDLFAKLLDELDRSYPTVPLVFLGDYIDRGLQAKEVLHYLIALDGSRIRDVTCLMGNHESMLLDFFDTPESSGPLWLKNGGQQTLRSFGITSHDLPLADLRDLLSQEIGSNILEWLRQRPLLWESGNVAACHAGGDPTRELNVLRGHSLLWGHPKHRKAFRQDGVWMVHGHFTVQEPSVRNGRIEIDTGAWQTGRLTAAIIEPGSVKFVTT